MSRNIVLLIPGLMNPASIWDEVIDYLDRSIEPRVVDLTSQASIAEMAQDAWRLINDIKEEDNLLICGFSMGSYVALEMLSQPRQKINGAVLVGSSLNMETEKSAQIRQKTLAAIEKDFRGFLSRLVPFLVAEEFARQETRLHDMTEKMHGMGQGVAIRQNMAIAGRTLSKETLASNEIPVTLLCGTEDRVNPPRLSQEISELLRCDSPILIEGVGHMVPLEKPLTIAEQINKYF